MGCLAPIVSHLVELFSWPCRGWGVDVEAKVAFFGRRGMASGFMQGFAVRFEGLNFGHYL